MEALSFLPGWAEIVYGGVFIKHLLSLLAYILYNNIPQCKLISFVETLLYRLLRLLFFTGRLSMFEEMASDAVKMLIVLFWVTVASLVIWGALWVHNVKNSKAE